MTRVAMLQHEPPGFDQVSGIYPLLPAVGGISVPYAESWRGVTRRSWTLGHWLRQAGNAWSGARWNALVPVVDDVRLWAGVRRAKPDIAHFLWGEFAGPRWRAPYRAMGCRLVGTFHCSARRQPDVIRRRRVVDRYDAITMVSETQRPFFESLGVSPERLHCILLGVDSTFFAPAAPRSGDAGDRLEVVIVGNTERDHAFMAAVVNELDPLRVRVRVRADAMHLKSYEGAGCVEPVARMSAKELVSFYQSADVLMNALFDSTANDAVLEAMACGAVPVVTAVGGIPEYVPAEAGVLLEANDRDLWREALEGLATDRSGLRSRAEVARRRAEALDWSRIAEQYRAVYAAVMETA